MLDNRTNKKEKNFNNNKIEILSIVCIIIIMVLTFFVMGQSSKQEMFLFKGNELKQNYATTVISTWDISEKQDESVIAILDESGMMIISGSGDMKNYEDIETIPWFSMKDQITSVKIEEGITSIGNSAFYDCSSLTNIEISSSVTNIGYAAFSRCSSLTNIEISSAVTSIGQRAFEGCISLIKISIPENVSVIEECTFARCINLLSIDIPSNITSIKGHAFYDCCNLKCIEIPRGVTNIEDYAFGECEKLIVLCYKDSYGENYVIENQIPYQIIYITSKQYDIDQFKRMIKEIQSNTTIEEMKNVLESEELYTIVDIEENIINDETSIIKTGYKLKIEDGIEYKIIVKGDSNGDGLTDILDILLINKHRLNKENLEDEYLQAGDVNEDENVDIKDIFEINKFRLGIVESL